MQHSAYYTRTQIHSLFSMLLYIFDASSRFSKWFYVALYSNEFYPHLPKAQLLTPSRTTFIKLLSPFQHCADCSALSPRNAHTSCCMNFACDLSQLWHQNKLSLEDPKQILSQQYLNWPVDMTHHCYKGMKEKRKKEKQYLVHKRTATEHKLPASQPEDRHARWPPAENNNFYCRVNTILLLLLLLAVL